MEKFSSPTSESISLWFDERRGPPLKLDVFFPDVSSTFPLFLVSCRLYPEWNVRTSFISDHLFAALSLDAQRSSHAIEVPCPDANRINEIFDSISYSKGASVLRMLSTIVRPSFFSSSSRRVSPLLSLSADLTSFLSRRLEKTSS